jgi:hypothetical protein
VGTESIAQAEIAVEELQEATDIMQRTLATVPQDRRENHIMGNKFNKIPTVYELQMREWENARYLSRGGWCII